MFYQLSQSEYKLLLKAPTYVSLLATDDPGRMRKKKREKAADLVHVKSFTSSSLLWDYYKVVEETFVEDLDDLNKKLPGKKPEREKALEEKIFEIKTVVDKLPESYRMAFFESFNSYPLYLSKKLWQIF